MNNYNFINRMLSEMDIKMHGYKVLSVDPRTIPHRNKTFGVIITLESFDEDFDLVLVVRVCWFIINFFDLTHGYDLVVMFNNKEIYRL